MKKTPKKPLLDRKEVVPGDHELKRILGEIYHSYREILTLTETYAHEWKHYGKKFGWQLKVVHGGKALLWLAPQKNSFRLGFAVREKEKEVLLNSKLPATVKKELNVAKRYPEGYPLRLLVSEEKDMKPVRLVVEMLKSMRA